MILKLKPFEICPYGDNCPYANKNGYMCFGLREGRKDKFKCGLIKINDDKTHFFVKVKINGDH